MTRAIVVGIGLALLPGVGPVAATEVPYAESQTGMNEAAGADLKKADEELNAVYQQILKDYADDPTFVAKLRVAQQAWIAYRDADMDAFYPHVAEPGYYGSVLPMCMAIRKAVITRARTTELRGWLVGGIDGDACNGSIRGK
jgi:uncharacterized protein YecT (DUF1311 family)